MCPLLRQLIRSMKTGCTDPSGTAKDRQKRSKSDEFL
jgi:hypothetical protein